MTARRSRASAAGSGCWASTATAPGLMIPALSVAISSTVPPSQAVWSRETGVTTATAPSAMLVASQVPPSPTSTTATSTGTSAKMAKAIAGQHLEEGQLAGLLPVDHGQVGGQLLVGGHEGLGGDGLPVHHDPFPDGGQVRAGEQAGAQAPGAQQALDHPGGRGLAVRAGDVDDRVGPLRVAEDRDERGHPVQGRLDGVLGAAGEDLALRLAQLVPDAQPSPACWPLIPARRRAGRRSARCRRARRRAGPGSWPPPLRAPWPGRTRWRASARPGPPPCGRRPGPCPAGAARRPRRSRRRCPVRR